MMAYQRKTEDEYRLEYDYGNGDGPEVLGTYSTLAAAKIDKKAYIENEGIYPVIHKVRVRKEDRSRVYRVW